MSGLLIRALAACVALALLGLGVARAGEWERDRTVGRQQAGMVGVRQLVGPLGGRHLTGMRPASQGQPLTCFLYQAGLAPSAYELCWDSSGGLVEALDRTRGESHLRVWSLRWAPRDAPLHVSSPVLQSLAAQVQRRDLRSNEVNDAFKAILGRLGGLEGQGPTGHHTIGGLSCFVYGARAYELCWDERGRLLEAIDRSGGRRRVWSLRQSPWDAQIVQPPGYLERLVRLVPR